MNGTCITVWPLRDEPAVKSGGLTAVALTCIVVAVIAGGGALWAVFALAVLVFSLASYYVPTTYQIDGAGVKIARPWATRQIGWSGVGSIKHNNHGVWLLPGTEVSPTDAFRQVYIPVKGKERAAACAALCEENLHKHRAGEGQ